MRALWKALPNPEIVKAVTAAGAAWNHKPTKGETRKSLTQRLPLHPGGDKEAVLDLAW